MATASWWTCRGHDGMKPSKLRPSRSIGRRVMAFRIYSNMTAVRHIEFKKIIFNHVTDIVVLTCCCVPNFIKSGSRVPPPDTHNCRLFNAPLLGNGRCRGNRIMGTCRRHDMLWPPKLGLSRSISKRVMTFRIFSKMAAVRHYEFFKKD